MIRAESAHSDNRLIKLVESKKCLSVGSIREKRRYFDSVDGLKMAALSMSEETWPNQNPDNADGGQVIPQNLLNIIDQFALGVHDDLDFARNRFST